MGLERENRQPTPKEVHAKWLEAMEARYLNETDLASDWLVARVPALLTPSGFACGYAIHALKGLRRDRPDLTGDALLAAVLAYRDERLRAIGAEDLIVGVPGEDSDERVAA
jgi:hypothetical protein